MYDMISIISNYSVKEVLKSLYNLTLHIVLKTLFYS